jgi:hypothetical protein
LRKYGKKRKKRKITDKQVLIPENFISGNTLNFHVDKKVFSPQRGKMSFTGGIIEKIRKKIKKINTCSIVI